MPELVISCTEHWGNTGRLLQSMTKNRTELLNCRIVFSKPTICNDNENAVYNNKPYKQSSSSTETR